MLYGVSRPALSHDLQQGVRLPWCSTTPHIWPYVSFTTSTTFPTVASPQSPGEPLQGSLSDETASSYPAWREEKRGKMDCNCSDLGLTVLSPSPSAGEKKQIIESGMHVLLPEALHSHSVCKHIQMSK